MRITIHQPEHMPWIGFFHKAQMADTFVILDNVQYRKNYFQNRNKIRTSGARGWSYLTVPVKSRFGQSINEVFVDDTNGRWRKKYWDSLSYAYAKSPFFPAYSKPLKQCFDREWKKICEFNIAIITILFGLLGLKTHIVKSSELNLKGKGSPLLLDACKHLGAATYISGVSGKEYLNVDEFRNNGIEVVFQEFHHPIYKQAYEPFIPCMSTADLLFNHGERSIDIIKGVNVDVMEEVFL